MQPEFWHERWSSNRIGFHRDAPLPLLVAHWTALGLAPDARVFVPLCGKSLDMVWLAERGHRVLGVELSELAVRQFFDERGLVPAIHETAAGAHFVAGAYELIVGDAFALEADVLADCAAVYDRAALIALPPDLRRTYAATGDDCRRSAADCWSRWSIRRRRKPARRSRSRRTRCMHCSTVPGRSKSPSAATFWRTSRASLRMA